MSSPSGKVSEILDLLESKSLTKGATVRLRHEPTIHYSVERDGVVLLTAETSVELRRKVLALPR